MRLKELIQKHGISLRPPKAVGLKPEEIEVILSYPIFQKCAAESVVKKLIQHLCETNVNSIQIEYLFNENGVLWNEIQADLCSPIITSFFRDCDYARKYERVLEPNVSPLTQPLLERGDFFDCKMRYELSELVTIGIGIFLAEKSKSNSIILDEDIIKKHFPLYYTNHIKKIAELHLQGRTSMHSFYSQGKPLEMLQAEKYLTKNPALKSEGTIEYLKKTHQQLRGKFDIQRIIGDVYIYSELIKKEQELPDSLKAEYHCATEIYLMYLIELAETMYENGDSEVCSLDGVFDEKYKKFFSTEFDPSVYTDKEEFEFYSFAKQGGEALLQNNDGIFTFAISNLLGHLRLMNPARVMEGEHGAIYTFLKDFLSTTSPKCEI
ncbi:hypothetical protein [Legionella sp. km772]|uniref:hypothetical protein n=1 Tax=Legionella sp. km772 TaxID=2498111 RepID=UPI000FBBC846|nr:hypothetical protein [Legionella sp. km772]RUR05784.1 hypothetical protein ELY15_13895 [Legionella sp. km772]